MKREDLARLAKTQIRVIFLMVVVFLIGVGLSMTGALEKVNPRWTTDVVMGTFAALMIVVGVAFGLGGGMGIPRCPHCKRLLMGPLLNIAIASGNCGYCGKSIEK